MTRKNLSRFVGDAWRDLADGKVFAHEQAHHRDGQVEIPVRESDLRIRTLRNVTDQKSHAAALALRFGRMHNFITLAG